MKITMLINDDIIRKKQRKEAFRDSLGQETHVINSPSIIMEGM
jgi:hypothetical protein